MLLRPLLLLITECFLFFSCGKDFTRPSSTILAAAADDEVTTVDEVQRAWISRGVSEVSVVLGGTSNVNFVDQLEIVKGSAVAAVPLLILNFDVVKNPFAGTFPNYQLDPFTHALTQLRTERENGGHRRQIVAIGPKSAREIAIHKSQRNNPNLSLPRNFVTIQSSDIAKTFVDMIRIDRIRSLKITVVDSPKKAAFERLMEVLLFLLKKKPEGLQKVQVHFATNSGRFVENSNVQKFLLAHADFNRSFPGVEFRVSVKELGMRSLDLQSDDVVKWTRLLLKESAKIANSRSAGTFEGLFPRMTEFLEGMQRAHEHVAATTALDQMGVDQMTMRVISAYGGIDFLVRTDNIDLSKPIPGERTGSASLVDAMSDTKITSVLAELTQLREVAKKIKIDHKAQLEVWKRDFFRRMCENATR